MRALVISICLLACTGCIPVSFKPITDGSDSHFDPQFVGVWGDNEGYWELDAGNVSGSHPDPAGGAEYVLDYDTYDVYYTESGKTSELSGRLATIDGVTFMDLTPARNTLSNNDPGGEFLELLLSRPLHTWVKIELVAGKLRMLPVDLEYLNGVLEQDPGALPHIYPDDSDWPIITASTEQLRAFIAAHMGEEGFFGEMADLTKLGAPQSRHNRNNIQSGNNSYDQQFRSQPAATQNTYDQAEKKK